MVSEPRSQLPIKRVLVALDASPYSLAALRTAARLAASLGAKLEGIYVEDVNLLRIAELPFTREISIQSAAIRPIAPQDLERSFRSLSGQVEQWMDEVARQFGVVWTFRVLRGQIAAELMANASETDLLSLGRLGWPLSRYSGRLGSIARTILRSHRAPLLLLREEIRPGQPIAVTYSGDAQEKTVLAMAVHLARTYESSLTVLLVAETAEAAKRLQEQVTEQLTDWSIPVEFRSVDPERLQETVAQLSREQDGIILSRAQLRFVEELTCSLLLL